MFLLVLIDVGKDLIFGCYMIEIVVSVIVKLFLFYLKFELVEEFECSKCVWDIEWVLSR